MNGDPIPLVAKLLALWLGVEIATLVAPHLVIVAAGAAGSILGLMEWRQSSRLEAFGYVVGFTTFAWLFAGPAAVLAGQVWHVEHTDALLSPCAAGIGWIGHRWPVFAKWALARLRNERRAP